MKSTDISADSESGEKTKKTTQHSLDDTSRHQILSLQSQFIEFMPSSQMQTSLDISAISITQIFKTTLKKKSFNIIEDIPNLLTATLKPKFSIRKLIRCCIQDPDSTFQTTIRLHLSINEKNCKRIITIKGLCGNPFPISKVIQDFTERISTLSKTQQNGHYQHLQEQQEENFMTCKNQTGSYYEFCKVLSSDSYTLGKSISEFVCSFNSQYRNSEESVGLLPQPIESIKTKVEQTVQILFSDFNYGRSSAQRIMVYCRPAVQKYLFSKLIGTLISIYIEKHKNQDQEIQEKRIVDQIIPKLQLGELQEYDYYQSIQQLNKLNFLLSPLEKLNSLISVLSDAKSSVLQGSEGQTELKHQQEPQVLAFIILKSQIRHPVAELMLLRDWQENFDQDILEVFQEALNLILSFQMWSYSLKAGTVKNRLQKPERLRPNTASRRKFHCIQQTKRGKRSNLRKRISPEKSRSTSIKPQKPAILLRTQLFVPITKSSVSIGKTPTSFTLNKKPSFQDIEDSSLVKGQKLLNSFRKQVNSCIRKLKKGKIEFIEAAKFSQAFVHPKSREFFKKIKAGALVEVASLLYWYPQLVKQVDQTQKTALHWTCQRGYLQMTSFLLSCFPDIQAKDMCGRTPKQFIKEKQLKNIFENAENQRSRKAGFDVQKVSKRLIENKLGKMANLVMNNEKFFL